MSRLDQKSKQFLDVTSHDIAGLPLQQLFRAIRIKHESGLLHMNYLMTECIGYSSQV